MEEMQPLIAAYELLLQKEQEAERAHVGDYAACLAALEAEFAQARGAAAKPLTVPAIFSRSYDENFISDYLAYILDPARNGIGEAPLARLLELCGIEAGDLPLGDVTVHREYSLRGGRIDLLVEWKGALILGIENKILSAEGQGQTAYYAHRIPDEFPGLDYHLVYLTRTGEPAGSEEFRPVSYARLVEALRRVRLPADMPARRRVLWEDLLEHLEVYIVMSDPTHFEFSEKAGLYLTHQNMIDDLVSTFNREWGEAVAFIEQQLRANLEGGPWTANWSRGASTSWKPVFKPDWQSQDLFVHFEYWLGPAEFHRGNLCFMAEAEGSRADRFHELFAQRFPGLKGRYEERHIAYRPRRRKQAMAWKEYSLSQDVEQVAQVFIEAFEEFRFLEGEIDRVLDQMQKP